MKRINNLYDTLTYDKIKDIIVLASKGKKHRKEVNKVLENIELYTGFIYDMILNGNFYMLPSYHKNIIEKGKVRELTISHFFPNRILDYIIVETLKPYIKKSMYDYCIGNVDKRGMMYGKKIIAKKRNKYKYYIKLDIHKFYPNVKSNILYEFIKTKIKDYRLLKLIECVILSCQDLPIGSYYSQWFSNWFLQDIDHYIKEKLKIPFYIRYVDDMLLMSNNKKLLLNSMYKIQKILNNKGLELKRFEQVYTLEQRPIDFLGFRFYNDKIYLRVRNFKKMNKKLKHNHICVSLARSILSYSGWLKQTKLGYIYYKNHFKIKLGKLRKVISDYDKSFTSL